MPAARTVDKPFQDCARTCQDGHCAAGFEALLFIVSTILDKLCFCTSRNQRSHVQRFLGAAVESSCAVAQPLLLTVRVGTTSGLGPQSTVYDTSVFHR